MEVTAVATLSFSLCPFGTSFLVATQSPYHKRSHSLVIQASSACADLQISRCGRSFRPFLQRRDSAALCICRSSFRFIRALSPCNELLRRSPLREGAKPPITAHSFLYIATFFFPTPLRRDLLIWGCFSRLSASNRKHSLLPEIFFFLFEREPLSPCCEPRSPSLQLISCGCCFFPASIAPIARRASYTTRAERFVPRCAECFPRSTGALFPSTSLALLFRRGNIPFLGVPATPPPVNFPESHVRPGMLASRLLLFQIPSFYPCLRWLPQRSTPLPDERLFLILALHQAVHLLSGEREHLSKSFFFSAFGMGRRPFFFCGRCAPFPTDPSSPAYRWTSLLYSRYRTVLQCTPVIPFRNSAVPSQASPFLRRRPRIGRPWTSCPLARVSPAPSARQTLRADAFPRLHLIFPSDRVLYVVLRATYLSEDPLDLFRHDTAPTCLTDSNACERFHITSNPSGPRSEDFAGPRSPCVQDVVSPLLQAS